jgi:hypothetical protein
MYFFGAVEVESVTEIFEEKFRLLCIQNIQYMLC